MLSAYVWVALPLLIGNLWHLLMPFVGRAKADFKNSISENALRSKTVLFIHRSAHILLSICLVVYSTIRLKQGYTVAAILVLTAALLDTTQVVFLSKKTIHTPLYFRDIHQITAWCMSASYLLYTFALAFARHIPTEFIVGYVVLIVSIFLVTTFTKYSYFWFSQMAYFITVSIAMVAFAVL